MSAPVIYPKLGSPGTRKPIGVLGTMYTGSSDVGSVTYLADLDGPDVTKWGRVEDGGEHSRGSKMLPGMEQRD